MRPDPTMKDAGAISATNRPGAPVVSVIMPCWNRERFVADAIRSVLAQTLAELELIVVDDGSTDNSRDVVASFRDRQVRCLHREHRGISAALNAGLAAAQGRYIARLDSDDVWLPEMLATQVAALEAHPEAGLAYSRAECMDIHWTPLGMSWGYPLRYPGETFRSMVYNDCTCNITVVCRRECFARVGGYDETLATSEDLDMWLRVARHYSFVFTDRVLARVRLHDGSITGEISAKRDEQMERRGHVFDKLFATPGLPAEIASMRGLVYSNLHTSNGLLWLGHGKTRQALNAFRRAVQVSSAPGYTLLRIIWSGCKWQILPRIPGGRRLDAWMQRCLQRIRQGARVRRLSG
jgi:glycosyltransferase involved in cell wall biosynthesis